MAVGDRMEHRTSLNEMLPKVGAFTTDGGILRNIRRHTYHPNHSLLEKRVGINEEKV